eukprot:3657005-Prymnesium_polylepis.1
MVWVFTAVRGLRTLECDPSRVYSTTAGKGVNYRATFPFGVVAARMAYLFRWLRAPGWDTTIQ